MTTYFHPSNKELARGYGYAPSSNNLDQSVVPWTDLEWSRPLEIACTIVAGVEQSAEPSIDGMTADDTCPELNDIHDWILAIKSSKDRRRLDLLPALPDPDGVRPVQKKGIDIVKYYVELHSQTS